MGKILVSSFVNYVVMNKITLYPQKNSDTVFAPALNFWPFVGQKFTFLAQKRMNNIFLWHLCIFSLYSAFKHSVNITPNIADFAKFV